MAEVRRYAATVQVPKELMRDQAGFDINAHLARLLRRLAAPWEFAYRNPMPEFVPFPRMAEAEAILTGWRTQGWRSRLRDVRDVFLHGMPEPEREW